MSEEPFPRERHPWTNDLPYSVRLGLHWARIVRLSHPGPQYVVAPALDDGTIDMHNGVQDIWRDVAEADEVVKLCKRDRPDLDWHVWERMITPFEIDDADG